MGTLLLELGLHADALEMLGHSAALHGSEPGTACNLALCHMALGDPGAALAQVEQALALAPQMDQARALRIALEAQLA